MTAEKKDLSKEFTTRYKGIYDRTKILAENYYNMKNPVKEDLNILSKEVKALNKEFKKLILETVEIFPELAPNSSSIRVTKANLTNNEEYLQNLESSLIKNQEISIPKKETLKNRKSR